ncbi:MAG: molybdopterin oxidoreductase [Desulfobacterium sp.]|nr:molybdopterin oxidoreductase [Desulfobacterium sp.]
MKIDRRCFLSLGIGAAAGTALSPLPWKLMDDASIWTQNWPWTPVPPDGEISYTDSTCTLCSGGCGITVRKIDDRVVKIEGRENHPVNNGGICVLGLSGTQLLYGPTRVKSPMKKINGTFQKITWNQALSEITEKLLTLRAEGRSHTVAAIAGSSRGTVSALLQRFLTAYGSPNFYCQSSIEDSFSLSHIQPQNNKTIPGFDLENADYVLSFGTGIIDGWGSPVRMIQASNAWKTKNLKLIQVEPRLSDTAARSDEWLPSKPGTEAILALGIAHVILQESLYDQAAIDYHSEGFVTWRTAVLGHYHPDKVAEITGIDAKTIFTVGREFGQAEKPVAICGRGKGNTPVSVAEMSAIHALNVLVGNVNKKGGVFTLPEPNYISWPEISFDTKAETSLQTKQIAEGGLLHRLPSAINEAEDSVTLLFVADANPCYTLTDTKEVIRAFKKIPFKVSFSSYMDETAKLSDLILPNHSYLERYEDVPVTSGLRNPVIGLTKPIVNPLFQTKHTGDVIISIARAMKGSIESSFPWKNYYQCLKNGLGQHWNPLLNNGVVEITYIPEFEEIPRFAFQIPNDKPQVLLEGNENKMDLTLIPSDSMRLSSGYIGAPPFMMKTIPDTILKDNNTLVQIHPKTAEKLELKQGCYAILKTPRDEKKVKIHLSQGIGEDIISFPRGLGHTAYDSYLAGKGINFNELIGPVEDPFSGLDVAWGIRASLIKA